VPCFREKIRGKAKGIPRQGGKKEHRVFLKEKKGPRSRNDIYLTKVSQENRKEFLAIQEKGINLFCRKGEGNSRYLIGGGC